MPKGSRLPYENGQNREAENIKNLINLNGCKLKAFDLGGHRNCFLIFRHVLNGKSDLPWGEDGATRFGSGGG